MADDTLRLAAEIVDKWSGPLKDMAKAMKELQQLAEKGNKSSTRSSDDQTKKIVTLRKEWTALNRIVRSVAGPSLSQFSVGLAGVGLSAAGVGIAVAAAIAAVREFGRTSASLINVSQQTKFLKEQVLEFQIAGQGMGLSVGQINESLKSFSALMDQTNRRSIYAFQRWQEMPGLMEMLGGDQFTGMKDRMAQMRHAIDTINQNIPDADKRRRALSILGIPEDFAGFTKDQIDKFFDSAHNAVEKNKDKIDWGKGFDANIAFNSIASQLDLLKQRVASNIWSWFDDILSHPPPTSGSGGGSSGGVPTLPGGGSGLSKWYGGGTAWGRPGSNDMSTIITEWWKKHQVPNPPIPWQEFPPYSSGPLTTPNPGFGPKVMKPKNMSYGGGGDWQEFREIITDGTREGVIQGLREFANGGSSGSSGLLQKASFGGGGGDTGGGGAGSSGGFVGGGRHRMFVPGTGGGGRGGGGGSGAIDDHTGEGLAGSDYLKARRARFGEEFQKNPQTKEELAALLTLEHESDPVAVAESLMNRMDYSGGSMHGGIHSGFYGPVNRGQLSGQLEALRRQPKRMERMKDAIDKALGGSNLIRGATDQGSGNDPNVAWPGGKIVRHGETYNDWGGGPGGHEGARRYRERLMKAVEGEQVKAKVNEAPEGHAKNFRKGIPMKRSPTALLDGAKEAGMASGGGGGELKGSASLDITLAGFPRGTRTKMSSEGMLKEVKLNRGTQMATANEDG